MNNDFTKGSIVHNIFFQLGTTGVFLAEPISNFIGGSTCYITMLFTIWPELKTKN